MFVLTGLHLLSEWPENAAQGCLTNYSDLCLLEIKLKAKNYRKRLGNWLGVIFKQWSPSFMYPKVNRKICFLCPQWKNRLKFCEKGEVFRVLKLILSKTIILMNIYYSWLPKSVWVPWNEHFINLNLQRQFTKSPVSLPVCNISVLFKFQDVAKRHKCGSTSYQGLEGFFVVGANPKQEKLEAPSSLAAASSPRDGRIPFPGTGVWVNPQKLTYLSSFFSFLPSSLL